MILLVESAAGFALFRDLREDVQDLENEFSTLASAQEMVDLIAFHGFENTAAARRAISEVVFDLALSEAFITFLIDNCPPETLGVAHPLLAIAIRVNLGISCVCNPRVVELHRGVRLQLAGLIEVPNLDSLTRSLSHSIAFQTLAEDHRVDVNPIDELDKMNKQINTKAMRVKEWYGPHFPELARIIGEGTLYVMTVMKMLDRSNASNFDFSEILPDEEVVSRLREAAATSMGQEITENDLILIKSLCEVYFEEIRVRDQTSDLLTTRMNAMAPNLTTLVGVRMAARLMFDAGSLKKLSRLSGSKVQLLGARKIKICKAHKAPNLGGYKYGSISLARLVRQAPGWRNGKGKMCRSLAARVVLAVRCDVAQAQAPNNNFALASLPMLQARLASIQNMW